MWKEDTNKQNVAHVTFLHGLRAFASLNGFLQNCQFWPSLGMGLPGEPYPFILYSFLLL